MLKNFVCSFFFWFNCVIFSLVFRSEHFFVCSSLNIILSMILSFHFTWMPFLFFWFNHSNMQVYSKLPTWGQFLFTVEEWHECERCERCGKDTTYDTSIAHEWSIGKKDISFLARISIAPRDRLCRDSRWCYSFFIFVAVHFNYCFCQWWVNIRRKRDIKQSTKQKCWPKSVWKAKHSKAKRMFLVQLWIIAIAI